MFEILKALLLIWKDVAKVTTVFKLLGDAVIH